MTNSSYPQRAGEPECRDFLRTGRCKYGSSCKYHHPIGGARAINPNEPPFPIRPGETTCQYYLKNGTCKFGQTCRFHHPPEILLSKQNFSCTIVENQAAIAANGEVNSLYSNDSRHQQQREAGGDLPLPQRPGEPDCIYYLSHGKCKYGASCKFNHPPNSKDSSMVTPPRSHVQVSSTFRRQRSCSDSILDGRELQTYLLTGVLPQHQPAAGQVSEPYIQGTPIRRSVGSTNHLTTINNSFQQYNHQPIHSHSVSSPKMGSPSMSSTLASSYDSASLETIQPLPPSRVSGPIVIGSPLQQGVHSQMSSYPDIPMLNLSQGKGDRNGQRHYLSHSNSKEDLVFGPLIETRSLQLHGLQHQHPERSNQYTQTKIHTIQQGQSSNMSSKSSLSPPTTLSKEKKSPNSNSSIVHDSNNLNNNGIFNQTLNHSVVDDGLSMMTDALLTMLDTQDLNNHIDDNAIPGSNQNNFLMQMKSRRNNARYAAVTDSLPKSMLSDCTDRVQQQHQLQQQREHSSHNLPMTGDFQDKTIRDLRMIAPLPPSNCLHNLHHHHLDRQLLLPNHHRSTVSIPPPVSSVDTTPERPFIPS